MKKVIFYYEIFIFLILNVINIYEKLCNNQYLKTKIFSKYNQECLFVVLFYLKYKIEGMRLANILLILGI